MVIGIEASRANRLQKTGVEWYAYHLIQQLKALPEADAHSWLLYSNAPLMMGLERGPKNWHEVRLDWPPKYLWTQVRLSWEMVRQPPEVLFVPAHVLPRHAPKRSVVTVHDVGFRRFPEAYKPIQRWYHEYTTKHIVTSGARILTVSQFCKQEIMELYGAKEEQILVTPLALDHARFRVLDRTLTEPVLETFRLHEPYVAFVGRLERKKNVAFLVEAFVRYKAQRGLGDPLQLVLVGQPGAGYDELLRVIEASGSKEDIRVLGYVSEEEKAAILNRSLALVHPSLYEGFGITLLEAMACGVPVAASHVASLPEVAGEGNAIWFDPQNVDTCVHALERLVDDPAGREVLRDQGLAWVKRYDWATTARQTLMALTTW
jgi:glycosyltransferase involved in cell wall biosynthesis